MIPLQCVNCFAKPYPYTPPLPSKRVDLSPTRMAATARGQVSVSLIEASDHIMGTFDEKLVAYTTRLLENRKVGAYAHRLPLRWFLNSATLDPRTYPT